VSFPPEQVRGALAERFGTVEDSDDSGRLWFACRDPVAAA
jgi:hypothetical protein